MNINANLLENIIYYIGWHGMSESEFLSKCKVNGNFITKLRRKRLKNPTLIDVYRIAVFMGTSIDELISYTPRDVVPEVTMSGKQDMRVLYNKYNMLDAMGKARINDALHRELDRMKIEK